MLEVDIDIRRLVAFLTDETFEEKVIGRGIDRGNSEDIADRAIGRRSPALAKNALAPGKARNIIPALAILKIRSGIKGVREKEILRSLG